MLLLEPGLQQLVLVLEPGLPGLVQELALLVLLAVPLGNAYIGNYLSIYGGMDTQSYVLLMQSAVTGFQILGGVLLGLFGAAYLFRRKP